MKGEQVVPEKVAAEDEPALVTKTLVYHTLSFLTRWYGRLWHRLRVEGLEHLPREGGLILACNHQSFSDILLLGGFVPRHVSFVARDTLANWTWLAYTMRRCGAILVKRATSDRKALRAMSQHLALGDCVVIFVEGTRTQDGTLGELKGGAVLAARLAHVPIIPLGIRGAWEAWPRGRLIPFPKKIAIRYGPPIDASVADAQEQLENALRGLIGDGTYASLPPSK